jgi:chromosome segregation ATPase
MASDGGIGVKLRAEGEAEFKKALSDLNAQFKLIKSQLNLVSSEYDQNDKSAQAVAARSKVLTEQMEAQRSKIELLEKALASATTAYDEGDKRTMAYATQLNNAKAELNNFNSALESNQSELNNTAESTETAEDANKKLDDNISALDSSMKVLKAQLNLVSTEYGSNAKSVEALTAKQTVLNQQVDVQKQKVATLQGHSGVR